MKTLIRIIILLISVPLLYYIANFISIEFFDVEMHWIVVFAGVFSFIYFADWLFKSDDSQEDSWHAFKVDGVEITKNNTYEILAKDGIREIYYSSPSNPSLESCNYYKGEVKNGYRHGKGTYYNGLNAIENLYSGYKYIGEWKKGDMDGYGRKTYQDNAYYEGYFKKDEFHSKGKYVYSKDYNEKSYVGDFENGNFNGFGVMLYKDGGKYEGHWKNDKFHGKGRITLHDGSGWEGEWIEGEQFKGKDFKNKSRESSKPVNEENEFEEKELGGDTIYREDDRNWSGNGSGIIVSKDGYIITNHHVVEGANDLAVELNYNGELQTFKVKIIRLNKKNDLAILKISDKKFKSIKTIPYTIKKTSSKVGADVFALGYPMALNVMGKDIKFTEGRISAKSGYMGDTTYYQVSTPIQPGNSGGPLFDFKGNLVGIIAAGIKEADNVGYAIKSSVLTTFIEAIPTKLSLPNSGRSISKLPLEDQIEILSNFVVLIKIN